MIRDLLAALSLGNLCFLTAWARFLPLSANLYYIESFPRIPLISLVGSVVAVAAGLLAVVRLLRKWSSKWPSLRLAALYLLPIALVFPAYSAARLAQILLHGKIPTGLVGPVLILLLGAMIIVGLRLPGKVMGAFVGVLLMFSPAVLVTFGWAFYGIFAPEPATMSARPVGPRLPTTASDMPRVVWIIFDEWDERLSFTERPTTVQMPELDRFRNEAIFATNAYAPAGRTAESIPALLTGRLVAKSAPLGAAELLLTYSDSDRTQRFSQQPTVLAQARAAGFNTGLSGWYHPYCRMVASDLTTCFSQSNVRTNSLTEATIENFKTLSEAIPLAQWLQLWAPGGDMSARAMIPRYQAVMQHGLEMVGDPSLGFVFVHLPVPHPGGYYDRDLDTFSTDKSRNYVDNLRLVDRTFAEIRHTLEEKGLWDSTTVILSSDHWYRDDGSPAPLSWSKEDVAALRGDVDHRIPFLIKLGHATQGITYAQPFNAVLTHDLILAILKQKLTKPEEIVSWLDQHRTIGESPYKQTE